MLTTQIYVETKVAYTEHAVLVYMRRLNLEEHGTNVETVQEQSRQVSGMGQYNKCAQYDFKFTSKGQTYSIHFG